MSTKGEKPITMPGTVAKSSGNAPPSHKPQSFYRFDYACKPLGRGETEKSGPMLRTRAHSVSIAAWESARRQ